MILDPSLSLDEQQLAIDRLRAEIEQDRLELDKQFFRKYAVSIVALALCVAFGIFGLVQVRVANINRSAEITLEHHRATFQLKLDLIKEFSTAFHKAAHTYHSLWLRIEWLDSEMAKAPPKRDQRKINAWRHESQALRADFLKAEPLEGALFKISALYTLPDIKELCSEFLEEWKSFNHTYDEMLKKSYNEQDPLSTADVEASQTAREKIEARLDLLRGRLLILMYKELGESD
ncbi:MAG: hypothetical protein MRJ66_01845 [Nitrospira sp.]|nr:hypothetical protein [Nitrospira sp.]